MLPQKVRAVPSLDAHALIGHGWVPGDDYLALRISMGNAAAA
jgi:hypothetical protein